MRALLLTLSFPLSMVLVAQQPMTLEQCLRLAQDRNLDLRNAMLDAELASNAHALAFGPSCPT